MRLSLALLLVALAPIVAHAQACLPGIAVNDPVHCKFFVYYQAPGEAKLDDRLTSRLTVLPAAAPVVRSFALVIGIDEYPNFDLRDRLLTPARNDLQNLVPFLKEQEFDEIIVLHNADASRENIDYFLNTYLQKQLDLYGPATRVLVAHSGHGGPGQQAAQPGYIVLSDAMGARDYEHMYSLDDLAPKLRRLAAKSYHFVALLGSCYSGGVFAAAAAAGSNDWNPREPGAHAISSTPHDDLAYGLGDQHGSIFFDSLIQGVRSGDGDVQSAGWVAYGDGELRRIGGGIVRLGTLASYISGRIEALGINPDTHKPFPQILLGRLSGDDHAGAFFFLGPPKQALIAGVPGAAAASIGSDDTGSAIIGRSEIKVFSPPDSYRVKGIDVSHYNGKIEWPSVAASGVRFAYMKATQAAGYRDPTFERNWAGAAQAGLRRGAYHVFDTCVPVEDQLAHVRRTVPNDAAGLPVAVDLELLKDASPAQPICGDPNQVRAKVLQFATRLTVLYGKPPIIFGNPTVLNGVLDEQFLPFAIWLQLYGPQQNPLDVLRLKGRNPWSLWQYSSRGLVPGIKGNVDRNVFYGTEDALGAIVAGQKNPALAAATAAR